MKNNYAIKNQRPDSFPDDKEQTDANKFGWPNLPRGFDSMPDPAKVKTPEQVEEAARVEKEAYERFLKNRSKLKAKMPSVE
jgi:hypothetical protein